MKESYSNRPADFRRKILVRNIEKARLLEEEHDWLSLIKDEELGKKYYNKKNHKFGHWANSGNNKNFLAAMALRKGKPLNHLKQFQFKKGQKAHNKGKLHLPGELNPFFGKKHTVESNEKNRLAHIGKPSAFKGKTHSKESNEKNRLAHLGKPSPRKGLTGKKHSDKTRLKMRETHAHRKRINNLEH